MIDREFVLNIIGVSLNRFYQPQSVSIYVDVDLDRLFDKVAPYRDLEKHFKTRSKSLETNGLQENQALVAKCFTTNIERVNTKYLVKGSTTFMLNLMMYECLLQGFFICECISRMLTKWIWVDFMLLLYLVTQIVALVKGLHMTFAYYPCNLQLCVG